MTTPDALLNGPQIDVQAIIIRDLQHAIGNSLHPGRFIGQFDLEASIAACKQCDGDGFGWWCGDPECCGGPPQCAGCWRYHDSIDAALEARGE